jgi:hypothetical protein
MGIGSLAGEKMQKGNMRCGNPQTPNVPDWRVFVPNPDISGDLSIVQGFFEV